MRNPPAARAVGRVFLVLLLSTPLAAVGVEKPSQVPAIRSELASQSLLVDVAVAGARLVAVGEQGHIIYSDDDGVSWAHADVPVSLMLTAVSFATPQKGWAVGHEGIVLATSDGGEHWAIQLDGRAIAERQVTHAQSRLADLQAVLDSLDDAADREEAEFERDDAQFVLEDAEAVLADGITTPLLGIEFFEEDVGYAFGAYGLVLTTSDAGENWQLISGRIENPANYHFYGMARSSSGVLIIAGEAGVLHRSLDEGQSWERLRTGYEGSLFGVLAPPDASIIVFGLRGHIFRSTDDGETWSSVQSPSQQTLLGGALFSGGGGALVGAGGTLLLSTDHGQSFALLDSGSRNSLSGVSATASGKLLLAGFGGVRLSSTQGATER